MWIDTDKQLPEAGQIVLAYLPKYVVPNCYRTMKVIETKGIVRFYDSRVNVAHQRDKVKKWMAIPPIDTPDPVTGTPPVDITPNEQA